MELARGGTILIDEIDDLSMDVQLRLMRFLQEHSFERVGGNASIKADVRVLCATKRSLLDLVAAGRFRDDLFYRINTIAVELPALRDRGEDIVPLAMHFGRALAGDGFALTADALRRLVEHRWPGNVRELKHAIEHALVFAKGQPISAEHLRRTVLGSPTPLQSASPTSVVRLELADLA